MNLELVPIRELHLPSDALEKIRALGIKTAYDFVLFAYFDEQRQLLTEYLSLSRVKIDTVLDDLLCNVPTEVIDRLARRARDIRRIPNGLIPPDHKESEESLADQSETSGRDVETSPQEQSSRTNIQTDDRQSDATSPAKKTDDKSNGSGGRNVS